MNQLNAAEIRDDAVASLYLTEAWFGLWVSYAHVQEMYPDPRAVIRNHLLGVWNERDKAERKEQRSQSGHSLTPLRIIKRSRRSLAESIIAYAAESVEEHLGGMTIDAVIAANDPQSAPAEPSTILRTAPPHTNAQPGDSSGRVEDVKVMIAPTQSAARQPVTV